MFYKVHVCVYFDIKITPQQPVCVCVDSRLKKTSVGLQEDKIQLL